MKNKQYKILVLDDEKILGEVLCEELKKTGYEAYHLILKTEGYDWILESKPDLIISDIKSPVMDGFQLLRWLKANPMTAQIHFIFCTGFADLKNAIYAMKLGASDFVKKPYDLLDLLETIKNTLEQEWHPDVHKCKNEKIELQFLKWEQQCGLFNYVADRSTERMTEIQQSNAWDIYFIVERKEKITGGLFTKPLDFNELTYQSIYNFREWLDEKELKSGFIMGFYKDDKYVNNFARWLNITVISKNETEKILTEGLLYHKIGKRKTWFEDIDIVEMAPDSPNEEMIDKLLQALGNLDGKKIFRDEKYFKINTGKFGIHFITEEKNNYYWVGYADLLRIFTRLLVDGRIRKDEFCIEERETEFIFDLFKMIPMIRTEGEVVYINEGI